MDDPASEFPQPPPAPTDPPARRGITAAGREHASRGRRRARPELIFGRVMDRAISSYFAQWTHWLMPAFVMLFIGVAAMCCCCTAAIYLWAARLWNVRLRVHGARRPASPTGSLRRGWGHLLTASFAGLLLVLLNIAPLVILFVAQIAVTVLVAGLENLGPQNGPPGQQPLAP